MSNTVRAVTLIAAAICCAGTTLKSVAASTKPDKHFNSKQRIAAIRRAHVWTATDVPSMDMRVGPQEKNVFVAGETVACD